MALKVDKLTVRLPKDLIEAIDTIVKERGYNSKSDVVRSALEDFIADLRVPVGEKRSGTERIVVDVPLRALEVIDFMTQEGYIHSRESAIFEAVDKYANSTLTEKIECVKSNKEKMEQLAQESRSMHDKEILRR